MKQTITISEYAKIKGISTTAVYKQLKGRLKRFETTVDGKKCLFATVLELDENKVVNQVVNKFETGSKPVDSSGNNAAATGLETAIEALRQQLQEKDKQIERLQAETAELRRAGEEKDKFIQEQARNLSLLLEQSQELQRNNQILLRYSQIESQPKEEEKETESEPEQKKGFLKKFFNFFR